MKKNVFFRALPELPNPPPMTPIWATWSSFFGRQNSRFESQFRTKLDQGALGMSDPCGPYNWPFNPNQYSELTAFLEFLLLYSLLCCPLPSGRPKLYRDPGDQVVGLPYRVRMSLIYSFFVPEYATKY